jgi:hypothetical protein
MPITSISDGLTAREREVYERLLQIVRGRELNSVQAPRVVAITDLGRDYDDLAAMIVLKELHRIGLIYLEAFVTCTNPARERAILGRTFLDLLGLPDVPIGIGTAGPTEYSKAFDYGFKASFMPDNIDSTPSKDNFFEDGSVLLHTIFTKAIDEDRKVDLLLISPLSDIAQYAKLYPNVFREGVGKIFLQGGYSVSTEGVLDPRADAANNFDDMPAAREFHEYIERNDIPSVVYTRIAAFAARIPAEIFSDLEASQHPIGTYLRQRHVQQNITFYEAACSAKPYKDITQERFLCRYTNFYKKHPPGLLRSPNGTPLPLDGTPLPEGDQVEAYLIFAIVADALPALHTSGEDVVALLGVLDTKGMGNQASIHKVVGIPKLRGDLHDTPNIHPDRMIFAISTLLKGSLYNSVHTLSGKGPQ